MSIYTAIIILIVLAASSIFIYRDIMAPVFIMTVPWFFSFCLLIGSELYYKVETIGYLYIVCGIIIFHAFYGISFYFNKRKRTMYNKVRFIDRYYKRKINIPIFCVVVFLETLAMLYYTQHFLYNQNPILVFEYLHKLVFAFFYILILHYCTCNTSEAKITKRCIIIQVIPLILALLLPTNGRASYFVFLIGALFIYLSYNKYNNRVILKYLVGIILSLLMLFIYVAIRKNHIAEGTAGTDLAVQTLNWLTHYFSGSLITFSEWLPHYDSDFSFGKNTFRIFDAILSAVGVNVEVSSTFFPFMRIGPYIYSIANVYTIFYTYIIDFGFFGGLFIEALLGVIYAKLYINKDSGKIGDVYLYAVLMYALLMQFFGDQYVAIASYYLQMYLWYFIFYKCQILFFNRRKGIVLINY